MQESILSHRRSRKNLRNQPENNLAYRVRLSGSVTLYAKDRTSFHKRDLPNPLKINTARRKQFCLRCSLARGSAPSGAGSARCGRQRDRNFNLNRQLKLREP